MTPLELEDIATELREGRPEPTEDFAAELDRWAAEGFPSGAHAEESAPARLRRPRRPPKPTVGWRGRMPSLAPTLVRVAMTLLILAIPVTVVVVGGRGGSDQSLDGGGGGEA